MARQDRRDFFKTLGGAALGAVSLGHSLPSALAKGGAKPVALPLAKLPQLKKTGGSVVLKLRGRQWLLVRTGASEIHALSAVCTHANCLVHYEQAQKQIACKCHRSHFDLQGKALSGPAKKPLTKVPARIEGERILLDLE